MSNGTEHHGGSPDGIRPRRKAATPPRPIGWRAANRIVKGQRGGPGTEDLHALIAIASAPPSAAKSAPSFTSASAEHARATESAGHEAMLAAFRESGAAWETGVARRGGSRRAAHRDGRKSAGRSARSRQASLALVLRFATAVLIVCGVGVAAASAGVLPPGVQRIAHQYLGIGGVSTPSTHVPSSSAVTTGAPGGNSSNGNNGAVPSMTGSAAPASSAVLVSLCQRVFQDPGKWQQDLPAADQATLITAAQDEHKVKSYCAQLLADVGKDATPSPGTTRGNGDAATGAPSLAPSAVPTQTQTHGKAHVSRSPEVKGDGG